MKASPPQDPQGSSVTQDYLKTIYAAQEWGGDCISINDIASAMGVVPSTASENVKRLTDQGLVLHEPYQKVHLTTLGRSVAIAMVRRHRLLETYLYEKLDFEWDEVHQEAEVLEHAVSDTLLEHLDRALNYPLRDPHGDPIPSDDGSYFAPPMRPLAELDTGETGVVARISDSSSELLRHLEGIGLVLDASVRVIKRSPAVGTVNLSVTPPRSWPCRRRENNAISEPKEVDLGDVVMTAVYVASPNDVEQLLSQR